VKGVDKMQYSFGTNEYIEYVLDRYSSMLIKLAFTYLKNIADAEDIVQEVFVNLIKREFGFESVEHEKAWLLRVTINKCKNHLNSAWIKKKVPLDEELSYLKEEDSEVLEYVLELPHKYRCVIHLYYYENYSINEIAALLKKKPATIGTWLARGRNLLKSSLIGGFMNEKG
jgi:RNA polymerase sigma-70 factor (ECF subfamily)